MSKIKDEISMGPEIAPGAFVAVRRQGNEEKEVVVRPVKDGDPIHPGSEITVIDSVDKDGWREVLSSYRHEGPAQVATPAYREGYDRIFGRKQEVGLA